MPLIGFLLLSVGNRWIPRWLSGWIATGALCFSGGFLVLGMIGFRGSVSVPFWDWISVGPWQWSVGFMLDPLAIWLSAIVIGIGAIIHFYSIGYMADDSESTRFFGYMNLFIFFMLILILSDGLLGMFIGWEGVGLCSYLLIGFWSQVPEFNAAAKKAFVMNRIGDLGILLGMLILMGSIHSLQYRDILMAAGTVGTGVITCATIAFLVGVAGKSAQIPLYTWLPDAMAGPTPVSALIHAATMVTAGVYLVIRLYPLFLLSPLALSMMIVIGTATAFVGAVMAMNQDDIKKILAYSTVSQLALMVVALGLGAPGAALIHLTTHAIFKALLFLMAGAIIHALHGEQNIWKMGGLFRFKRGWGVMYGIGIASLMGVPWFAGFFSKDAILVAASQYSMGLFWVLVGISILTAIYSVRSVILVFFGSSRFSGTVHGSTWLMDGPLVKLAALSLASIAVAMPFCRVNQWLLNWVGLSGIVHESGISEWMGIGTAIVVAAVILVSLWRYRNPVPTSQRWQELPSRLVDLDIAYHWAVVVPVHGMSGVLGWLDGQYQRGIWGGGSGVIWLGSRMSKWYSGVTGRYLVIIGIVLIIALLKGLLW